MHTPWQNPSWNPPWTVHNSLTHSYYGTNWTRLLCSILFLLFHDTLPVATTQIVSAIFSGFFPAFFSTCNLFPRFFSSTPFYRLINSKLFPTSNVLLGNCTSMRFCTVRVLSMEIHINYTTNGNRKPRIRRKKAAYTRLRFFFIDFDFNSSRPALSVFNFQFSSLKPKGIYCLFDISPLFRVFPHPGTTIKIELNRVNTARVDIPICDLHFTKA